MRALLLETELVEEMKWGSPCYTLDGKNVLMMSSFRDTAFVSFFKGVALDDPEGVLESPGPNSRFARNLKFRSVEDLVERRHSAQQLIRQAIELERSGRKITVDAPAEPMPEELEERLAADPELRRQFDALTPGRRRSHVLHIGGGKQSATRLRRVEKCVPKIVAGKGFNER